jgi:hypothetical protein
LPMLSGLDLGAVLGFQVSERIPRCVPQAAVQAVDRIHEVEEGQPYGTIVDDLHGKPGTGCPPEPFPDRLRDHDLALTGDARCRKHECHLTQYVRQLSSVG